MSVDGLIHMQKSFDLAGETALITGGGTGLGLGIAKCFVAAGAKVVIVGRRREELEKARGELGESAFALAGDVTQLESIPQLVAEAEKLAGPISILVNNAGVHLKKSALETTDAEFHTVLQTHVFGAFALSREVGKGMVARKHGSILFTASMATLFGIPLVVATGDVHRELVALAPAWVAPAPVPITRPSDRRRDVDPTVSVAA